MKNNYLINKNKGSAPLGRHWVSKLLFGLMLTLIGNYSFAQLACTNPIEFTLQVIDETAPNAGDAKVVISGVPNSDVKVGGGLSSGYAGALTGPFSGLTAVTEANTIGRYVQQGLPNPAVGGTNYTARVQWGNDSCYTEKTVFMPSVNWSTTPPVTDLEVNITKSGDATALGGSVVFTVTVTNNNTNAGVTTQTATDVVIQAIETNAAGLNYVGSNAGSGGDGAFDNGTKVWTVGDVAAGETKSIELTYTIDARGVYQIRAEVVSTTSVYDEYDSEPNDGSDPTFDDEDDEGSICVSAPWDWCSGDEFTFQLAGASPDYTYIEWQYSADGTTWSPITSTPIANGSYRHTDGHLVIGGVGYYNFTQSFGVGPDACPAEVGCCPILVEEGVKPDLAPISPIAICYADPFPDVVAIDNTAPGDYDSDRGPVAYQWYTWDGTDPGTMAAIANNDTTVFDWTGMPDVAGTYHYALVAHDTQHTTCTDTTSFDFVITDIEKPIASENTPVCEEDQIELTVTNMADYPGTDYEFNWWFETDSSRWNAAGDSVGIASAAYTADIGTYVVRVYNNFDVGFGNTQCSRYDTVSVEINPLPDPPVLTDAVYCQNNVIAALPTHVADSSTNSHGFDIDNLNWYVTGSFSGSPQGTNSTAVANARPDSTQDGTYGPFYVTMVDINGCESYPDSFTIVINELPDPPAVEDLAYCEGETGAAALTAVPTALTGFTLAWYGQDSTGAETPAPIPSTALVDTLYFFVTQTDTNSCESYNATLTVFIKDTPDAPTYVDPVYCLNETADPLSTGLTQSIASTTTPSETRVHWTYPGQTPGATTDHTPSTTEAGSSYGLVWEEWDYLYPDGSTNTCRGPEEDLTVVVNPLPVVDPIAVQALCIGEQKQDDGNLYVTNYTDSDTIRWHLGNTFDINLVDPTDGTVLGSQARADGGVFASGLSSPATGTGGDTYVIQITNEFNCVQVDTVEMTEKDCECPGGYCEPAQVQRIL